MTTCHSCRTRPALLGATLQHSPRLSCTTSPTPSRAGQAWQQGAEREERRETLQLRPSWPSPHSPAPFMGTAEPRIPAWPRSPASLLRQGLCTCSCCPFNPRCSFRPDAVGTSSCGRRPELLPSQPQSQMESSRSPSCWTSMSPPAGRALSQGLPSLGLSCPPSKFGCGVGRWPVLGDTCLLVASELRPPATSQWARVLVGMGAARRTGTGGSVPRPPSGVSGLSINLVPVGSCSS